MPPLSSSARPLRRLAAGIVAALTAAAAVAAGPITFTFAPPPSAADPTARELWADVVTPSGRTLRLPAFAAGNGSFAVRARPDEAGTYRLGAVREGDDPARLADVAFRPQSPAAVDNPAPTGPPAIRLDATAPGGFRRADGIPYVPVGANLAWSREPDVAGFYERALATFGAADLNWMRVWLTHWGGLNPAWLEGADGPSPAPGGFSPLVAARWDRLVAAAESHRVYLQVVLQHHGQFSTTVNPTWEHHPWNVRHPGGFLARPADFFTDETARRLTRRTYRELVARLGWSPAVFAWELFNEVHWVDALRLDHAETAVARWHAEMAAYLRAIDPYARPVTTSIEDLRSPVVAAMDFLQPHLYAADLVLGARTFAPRPAGDARPVFYGEFGDDHLPLTAEQKATGLADVPPAWAGLFGEAGLPAQPWEGWRLLATGRIAELGAVARFIARSGWLEQRDLRPISLPVESTARLPLVLAAGQRWQRRPAPDFALPVDGTEPPELAEWPAVFVSAPSEARDGFPSRGTVRVDFPRATVVTVRVTGQGRGGAALRVLVDGTVVAERTWPAGRSVAEDLAVPVAAGPRRIELENSGGADWVEVAGIDLGLDASALAALARRNDRFIAAWVRQRGPAFSAVAVTPTAGTLAIPEVPAGRWTVTWWDAVAGTPAASEVREHPGGRLSLPVPPVARHAVVVLVRSSSPP